MRITVLSLPWNSHSSRKDRIAFLYLGIAGFQSRIAKCPSPAIYQRYKKRACNLCASRRFFKVMLRKVTCSRYASACTYIHALCMYGRTLHRDMVTERHEHNYDYDPRCFFPFFLVLFLRAFRFFVQIANVTIINQFKRFVFFYRPDFSLPLNFKRTSVSL